MPGTGIHRIHKGYDVVCDIMGRAYSWVRLGQVIDCYGYHSTLVPTEWVGAAR